MINPKIAALFFGVVPVSSRGRWWERKPPAAAGRCRLAPRVGASASAPEDEPIEVIIWLKEPPYTGPEIKWFFPKALPAAWKCWAWSCGTKWPVYTFIPFGEKFLRGDFTSEEEVVNKHHCKRRSFSYLGGMQQNTPEKYTPGNDSAGGYFLAI